MDLTVPRRALVSLVVGAAVAGVLAVGVASQAIAGVPASCGAAPVSTVEAPGGWDYLTESRTGGHREYVDGGLRVWTDGTDMYQAKSAGYLATDFPLSDAGDATMDVTQTSGSAPGLQLTLYVDGQWKGNLVHEPLFDDWWINKAIAGLPAGPNPSYQLAHGTLDQIIAAYAGNGVTDLRVGAIGFSLGSGAIGDVVIHSITAGCTTHAFSVTAPTPTPTATTPTATTTVTSNPTSTPTSTPSSPAATDLTPATEGLVTVTGDLVPGGDVTVTVPGHRGEQVVLVVFSTPQSLGTHTLTAQSTTGATLPADLAAGAHRVAAYSLTGALLGWAPVTVGGQQLAATGSNPWALAVGVVVALLAGSALVVLSRRPRPVPARVARHR